MTRTSWNVRATPERATRTGEKFVSSFGPNDHRPAAGFMKPDSTFSKVVLPAPFAPKSAVIAYSETLKETPSRAQTPPNRLVILSQINCVIDPAPGCTFPKGREAGTLGLRSILTHKVSAVYFRSSEPASQRI